MKYLEVMKKCKEKGISYSRMTIHRAGLKNGFIVKGEDGRNIFKEDVFNNWVEGLLKGIPEDCVLISDAVNKHNIPYSYFSFYFKKYNVEVKQDLTGLNYVRKSDVDEVVRKYNNRTVKKGVKRND